MRPPPLPAGVIERAEDLLACLRLRDAESEAHCRRVARLSLLLSAHIPNRKADERSLYLGALLHDIGKLGMPDAILHKDGRLTPDERAVMERHPDAGAEIVGRVKGLVAVRMVIKHHHERWDGDGYPVGLAGEQIPVEARIVAVADAYDAMTTARSYQQARSYDAACKVLIAESGRQFDPQVVAAFMRVSEDDLRSM